MKRNEKKKRKFAEGAKKRIKSLRKYRIKVERVKDKSTWLCLQKRCMINFITDYINCNLHFEFMFVVLGGCLVIVEGCWGYIQLFLIVILFCEE